VAYYTYVAARRNWTLYLWLF